MPDRSKDWLNQAKRDFKHAANCLDTADYEWACFSAQQAAEKAVKAVFLNMHGEGWGHSVYKLLKELGRKTMVPGELFETAKDLDKHYIPTRYPNGFDSGMPGDYYSKKDAKKAIENAGEIIEFCEGFLR